MGACYWYIHLTLHHPRIVGNSLQSHENLFEAMWRDVNPAKVLKIKDLLTLEMSPCPVKSQPFKRIDELNKLFPLGECSKRPNVDSSLAFWKIHGKGLSRSIELETEYQELFIHEITFPPSWGLKCSIDNLRSICNTELRPTHLLPGCKVSASLVDLSNKILIPHATLKVSTSEKFQVDVF